VTGHPDPTNSQAASEHRVRRGLSDGGTGRMQHCGGICARFFESTVGTAASAQSPCSADAVRVYAINVNL